MLAVDEREAGAEAGKPEGFHEQKLIPREME